MSLIGINFIIPKLLKLSKNFNISFSPEVGQREAAKRYPSVTGAMAAVKGKIQANFGLIEKVKNTPELLAAMRQVNFKVILQKFFGNFKTAFI